MTALGGAEHLLGVSDAQAITAADLAGDTGGHVVGLGAGPVALQFEQVLERGHRAGAGLDHPLDCTLVRLGGDVAAGIGDNVSLEALLDRREHRADDADAGPQAGEHQALLADAIHFLDHPDILPGVHAGAVEHGLAAECVDDLVEHGPEKLFSATVVRMVGTLNPAAAWLTSAALLRSSSGAIDLVAKAICDWKSIRTSAWLVGESSDLPGVGVAVIDMVGFLFSNVAPRDRLGLKRGLCRTRLPKQRDKLVEFVQNFRQDDGSRGRSAA
ncbi:hypothetical protein NOVOSPHI9U_50218 [Novosphingobium sp. 9U]|nr:hypothetical protein NOVOSPHI9U_50218 [Novosphingobium sp. 9U]